MSDQPAMCERCTLCPARRTYLGKATCERCELALRAISEPKRMCPVDGALMAKRLVGRLLVDDCTLCGGVWLDAGELDILRREMASPSGQRSIGNFLGGLVK